MDYSIGVDSMRQCETVVVLNFPDEDGAKHFITQIETQNLLKKIGMEKTPISNINPSFKSRVIT